MWSDICYLWGELRWYIIAVILFMLVSWFWFECQYEAIKKYYPRMSRWEYVILEDKIRVVPDG